LGVADSSAMPVEPAPAPARRLGHRFDRDLGLNRQGEFELGRESEKDL